MKSAIIAIAVTLTITTLATAQNERAGHKHINSLDKLIGRWETRMKSPGNGQEGTLELELRYVVGKRYILLDTRFRPDNVPKEKSLHLDFVVIGYSKEESTTKVWKFERESQESATVEISDGKIVGREQDGKPGEPDYRSTIVTTRLTNDDTLEYTNVIVKGTKTRTESTTLKRVK